MTFLGTCDCGRVATARCSDLWPHEGLVACERALCRLGCVDHRHGFASMGYAGWEGATTYQGDEPDGPGVWEWLKSRCRAIFWTAPRKAQHAWDEVQASFPPPAPYPKFKLQVGQRVFEARGRRMEEVLDDPLDPEA